MGTEGARRCSEQILCANPEILCSCYVAQTLITCATIVAKSSEAHTIRSLIILHYYLLHCKNLRTHKAYAWNGVVQQALDELVDIHEYVEFTWAGQVMYDVRRHP